MMLIMIFLPPGHPAVDRGPLRLEIVMSLLQVDGLGINFGGITAVDDLTFEIPAGRIFSIIGPNGAGKTTLFNMISGIYRPERGRIRFDGQDVTGHEPHQLARLGLSRTFQNLQVFFRLTVLENVMVGRHLHEPKGILAHALRLPSVRRANRECAEKAREFIEFVGLGSHCRTHRRRAALRCAEAAGDRPRAGQRAQASAP